MNVAVGKNNGSGTKVSRIKSELLRQIKLNNFPRGSVLPPERELPARFGGSYMTVRKAIGELVQEKYLERQPGVGTFVRKDISRSHLRGVLGVICPYLTSPEGADFIVYAHETAKSNDWDFKLFFACSWEDRAVEDAWKTCDALWLFPPGPMNAIPETQLKMFTSFEKPAIFVGVAANLLGIDTVMGVPGQEMRIALDHFKKAGHRRVAYVATQYGTEKGRTINALQFDYASWREWVIRENSGEYPASLLCRIDVDVHTTNQVIYEHLMTLGRKGINFTGVVTSFGLALGVLSAFYDIGIKVGKDVSLIALGERQESCFYRPLVTHVSNSLREHTEKAMDAVNFRFQHPSAPAQCILIEPKLIKGKTVFPIR